MMLQKVSLILVICMTGCLSLILPDNGSPLTNPCAVTTCAVGTECRLKEVICVRAPCYPVPTCIQRRPTIVSCPIEKPVLSMSEDRDISCTTDAHCPDGTFCQRTGYGRRGGCCLQDTAEKPGACPSRDIRTTVRNKRCGRPCSNDNDCTGNWKCCHLGACGQMCTPPLFF